MKKISVWGVIITLAVSPLFRGLFFPLESSIFLTVIALLAVLYFLAKLTSGEPLHFNPWLAIPGALLIVAYGLSFINAVNVRENIKTIIQYTEYYIVFVILYDYYQDRKEALGALLMPSVVITGFIAAFIGLEALSKAFPFLIDTLHEDRVGSTFQYYNASVIYFAVCLIFVLTLMNTNKSKVLTLLLSGVGNTLLLALLLTGSKGGYLVGGLAFILVVLLQPQGHRIRTLGYLMTLSIPAVFFMSKVQGLTGSRDYISLTQWLVLSFMLAIVLTLGFELARKPLSEKKIKPIAILFILVSVVVLGVLGILVFKDKLISLIPQNILERWENFDFDNASFRFRLDFDKDALKLIRKYWLLGLGGGGWTSLYQSVQTWFYTAKAVHNQYFQVFVEAGILGFIAQVVLVAAALLLLLKDRYKSGNTMSRVQSTGVFCAFFAVALHSVMDFELSYPSIALLFWAMLAYSGIKPNESKVDETTAQAKPRKLAISLIGFLLVGACLFSANSLYSMAAYHAHKGQMAMESKKYGNARQYYEEALRLDPINSVYTFQLTKLYNYFAENTKDQETAARWREAALELAKRSVVNNPYYPVYLEILTKTYLSSEMPMEAVTSAQNLITYQPCNHSNYVLLARACLESGKYNLSQGNRDKGKMHLIECVNVKNMPYAQVGSLKRYTDEAQQLLDEME